MNPKVDNYLLDGCGRCSLAGTPHCKVHSWQKELEQLRRISLESDLTETLKWSMPCYTFNNKNILMISAFKNYASISFFKGALLKDSDKILTAAGENSQASRQIRFTKVNDIINLEPILKQYINEAIEIEKSGAKIDFTAKQALNFPDELTTKMNDNPILKKAFLALTPGRQRGYILHFSAPKQSKTRNSRIEKCIPKIMLGKGWNDR